MTKMLAALLALSLLYLVQSSRPPILSIDLGTESYKMALFSPDTKPYFQVGVYVSLRKHYDGMQY